MPADAHVARIVSAVSGERPIVAVGVTDRGAVRQIVAWINEMRRVPAGVAYSCPAYPGIEPTVTLTFRVHLHGAVLATAFETDPGSPNESQDAGSQLKRCPTSAARPQTTMACGR